ncbi:MAG: hypothetical protein AB3K77_05710 [Methanosarcinaceae archaeon]
MPSGVLKPYAGVSTAVLVFTRGGSTEKVWFYDMEADGYSLDDKRTPTDRKEDIPDIIESFGKRREEKRREEKRIPGTGRRNVSMCLQRRSKFRWRTPLQATGYSTEINCGKQSIIIFFMLCILKLWDLQTKARPGTVEKMISEEVGRRSFMNSNFFSSLVFLFSPIFRNEKDDLIEFIFL